MNSLLRNVLIGAGVAAVGAVGTKVATDYLRNRNEEETPDEAAGDATPKSVEEVAFVNVEPSSVQAFLDKSFEADRYIPNRAPKMFEFQGVSYMVIWAEDKKLGKNQMLAFTCQEDGRHLIASVGYTAEETDFNLKLDGTPFAIEVNDQQFKSGKSTTAGTTDVDLVLAA